MIEQESRFVDTDGELPPLWPRSVTFFANLLALFYGNEEKTRSLAAEVGEIDSYGARLIPILNLLFRGPNNVLVLEREPDETLCRYLQDDLKLSLPQMTVTRHRDYETLKDYLRQGSQEDIARILKEAGQHSDNWLDGYVTDETLEGIARHIGCRTITSLHGSYNGNNKLLLHEHLVAAGLPTFETVVIESVADLPGAAKQLASRGYGSAVLRSQIGASGIGMIKLDHLNRADDFPAVPDYFFFEGPCLLQGWMKPGVLGITNVHSPSTQLFVDDERVYAFDLTEQILSHDSIHQGNESPPPYLDENAAVRTEMMRQAESAGQWLYETGYRGTASIDWLVIEREGLSQPDVYVCEINARVTGATYPSLLARHFFPRGAWLLRNLRLRIPKPTNELLQMFERPGHLFHPDKNAGVLPLNLNFGEDNLVHKGQFLCIGDTTDECHRFLSFAESDLPIEWHDDRD